MIFYTVRRVTRLKLRSIHRAKPFTSKSAVIVETLNEIVDAEVLPAHIKSAAYAYFHTD